MTVDGYTPFYVGAMAKPQREKTKVTWGYCPGCATRGKFEALILVVLVSPTGKANKGVRWCKVCMVPWKREETISDAGVVQSNT